MIAESANSCFLRRLAINRCAYGDEGTTLIELVVGMTIMSIFLAIFTSAVFMMNGAQDKAQAVNNTSMQLNLAFLTLDKTVRYASAISTPDTGPSGDWYVELSTTDTGSEVCTQFRLDNDKGQLEKRTWSVPADPTPDFTSVASGITNGRAATNSPDQPFVLNATTTTVPFQRLTINLMSQSGSGTRPTTSRSSFTFGAINSAASAPAPALACGGHRD